METEIARFMLKVSKFEFYLVNRDIGLAHTRVIGRFNVVSGLNWTRLAQQLEAKHPFARFDFIHSPFRTLKETAPQFLVRSQNGTLRWDSDDLPINSWERLLARSFAQLRNNIAHGNKGQMPAAFTHERTGQFMEAANALISFVATEIFDDPGWETPIVFR